MNTSSVRERVLEHTQSLLMTRGYHGFSYRDLAERVGVKSSSIHYHFPTKEDLVLEAVNVYSREKIGRLRRIDPALPPEEKLERYSELFSELLGAGHCICLCGMLAADIESLPDNVRHAVQAFFSTNEAWLAEVLKAGGEHGTLCVKSDPTSAARALYSAFQGSVLSGRLFQTRDRITDVVDSVKAG